MDQMPVLLNPHNYDLNELVICADPRIPMSRSTTPLKFGMVKVYMLNRFLDHPEMVYFRQQPNKLIIKEVWPNGRSLQAEFTVVKIKDYVCNPHTYAWCPLSFELASKLQNV